MTGAGKEGVNNNEAKLRSFLHIRQIFDLLNKEFALYKITYIIYNFSDDFTIIKGYPIKEDILEEPIDKEEPEENNNIIDEIDENKALLNSPELENNPSSSLNYKDFSPSSKYSLLKPHLLSFFIHVYIDSMKVFEDFSKFTSIICKLVEKERNRLDSLISYKLDYPEYLFDHLLKTFTKLINILRTESVLGEEEEEKKGDSNKNLGVFKDFARSLMKSFNNNIFDREIVSFIIKYTNYLYFIDQYSYSDNS